MLKIISTYIAGVSAVVDGPRPTFTDLEMSWIQGSNAREWTEGATLASDEVKVTIFRNPCSNEEKAQWAEWGSRKRI